MKRRTKEDYMKMHAYYNHMIRTQSVSQFVKDQVVRLEKEYQLHYCEKLTNNPDYEKEVAKWN